MFTVKKATVHSISCQGLDATTAML